MVLLLVESLLNPSYGYFDGSSDFQPKGALLGVTIGETIYGA